MSFENNTNKEGSPEATFGNITGMEESEKFPGSKIISVEIGGRVTRYALRRDEQGKLQGNQFEFQELAPASDTEGYWKNSSVLIDTKGVMTFNGKDVEKYRVGPTYQMHQSELAELEKAIQEKGLTI